MKNQTLRDWLLARHGDVGPMLDERRRAALPEPRLSGPEFFRELFRPVWPAWATLAAAWVVITAYGVSQPPSRARELHLRRCAAAWSISTTQLNALLEETRTLH